MSMTQCLTLEQIAALTLLASPVSVSAPFGFSENTYEQLQALDLVHRDDEQAIWQIAERGRVLLEYLQVMPLPVQVSAWRMPSADPLEMQSIPPPPRTPPKPKRIIPTDPEMLRVEANRLMDQGFGMNEVKEQLELTQEQVQAFFFGH